MKFITKASLLILSLFLLSSCKTAKVEPETQDPNTTNDFTPPTGVGDHEGIEGPWARRLMGATSEDGITWTKTYEVITDQADVADLAVDDNGRLYLYYYAWKVGEKENLPAMAISDDNGKTWTFKYMVFEGFPNRGDVSDPNVVYDDGMFQLYGSTRDNGQTYLLHGESTDGIHFTYKGIAFQPETGNAGVAAAYKVRDEWHLLSLASLGMIGVSDDTKPGKIWHATSEDGESFELKDILYFKEGNDTFFHGNVVPLEDGYRLYVFNNSGGIRSFFSEDGNEWEIEEGYRLILEENTDLESGFLGDPDVIQLADGTYFMVYSTLIP